MNKTTTALTELIEFLGKSEKDLIGDKYIDGTPRAAKIKTIGIIRKKAISLLQKEREDMEKMALEVWVDEGYTKIYAAKRKATYQFDNLFTQYKTTDNE